MIVWLWPYACLLVPLPWLVRRFWSANQRNEAALTVPTLQSFSDISSTSEQQVGKRKWRLLLLWLVWLFLIIGTARPQWTGEPVTLPTSGRDLMLAVDISGSMATQDLNVNGEFIDRLTVVKAVVGQFIDARKGDRVGLVLFGTNAYLQAPLTFDLTSVNRLLLEAPVGIAGGKTAIGDAIGLAVKRLRMRPQEDKILILLTDGANNVGEVGPDKAAELAAFDNIKIYTVGVGAEEMRMPGLLGLGRRITNPSADLDEDTLRRVAETTGGRYFRAKNTQELLGIYQYIDELEPVDQDPETFRPTQALFYWPLGASLICFALFLLTGLRRNHAA
ncbi:MAG: VWA domain-containing protein [Gammaproteobacteria bacterium]|jgi:Ca-activated chloride channel homolog|nr:VWA domain-containing protein [Gammaproteobacteria bacterium]MCH1551603.1 VWA domain-containing protein [Pseudomonadales bacterium]